MSYLMENTGTGFSNRTTEDIMGPGHAECNKADIN